MSTLPFARSAVALVCALSFCATAQENDELETIVVTSSTLTSPNEVITDPKLPRQPLPAHDGADFLKTITGFNVIRKGGASGDPVFRSMAASRLTIMNDGNMVLGGCNSRMDPPTAYIAPQNYDQIRVIKGPQSVQYLPANAFVLFEREHYQLAEAGIQGDLSALLASYGRREANADLTLGNQLGYMRVAASRSTADNYEDADGNPVNSHYSRWSVNGEAAWTPDADTVLLISTEQSDGEAAYADRLMDGSVFDRSQWRILARKDNITAWLKRLEFNAFTTYVDHVMDNYSLRDFTPSMMMPNPSAMNPDRSTDGGRLVATLLPAPQWQWRVGVDTNYNVHGNRMTMNQTMMPFEDMPRLEDGRFNQVGLFSDASYQYDPSMTFHAGIRLDDWKATDSREMLAKTMMMSVANPTFGDTRNDTLTSGFMRIEHTDDKGAWYAGIGRAARFPDYWELLGKARGSETSASAFAINPEITHQADVGLIHHLGSVTLDASLFYAQIEDFILLEQQAMMGPETVRNVDAHTWGGEASISWKVSQDLRLQSTFAVSRGSNETDDLPLAQQSPDEMRIEANYRMADWQWGALWRLVSSQYRVAPNQGTIVGLDTTPTAGFGVLSLNAVRSFDNGWRVSIGVDNLLNKQYEEYLSKSSSIIPGFVTSERVPEPGRTGWLKLDVAL